MTHRRRLTRGPRPPQGYVPVTVVASEKRTPTVVIPAVTPEPAQTEVIAEVACPGSFAEGTSEITPEDAARIRASLDNAVRDMYAREPVPDLWSADPADRTEWFRLHDGDETGFAAVLNAHPDWLYLLDTSLPVPPRTAQTPVPAAEDEAEGAAAAAPEPADAAGTGNNPTPEAFPPPAGAPTAPGTSGVGTGTGSGAVPPSGEDRDTTSPDAPEPVQDEPDAEHDCAEDGGAA